jgi:hypothetical protein
MLINWPYKSWVELFYINIGYTCVIGHACGTPACVLANKHEYSSKVGPLVQVLKPYVLETSLLTNC